MKKEIQQFTKPELVGVIILGVIIAIGSVFLTQVTFIAPINPLPITTDLEIQNIQSSTIEVVEFDAHYTFVFYHCTNTHLNTIERTTLYEVTYDLFNLTSQEVQYTVKIERLNKRSDINFIKSISGSLIQLNGSKIRFDTDKDGRYGYFQNKQHGSISFTRRDSCTYYDCWDERRCKVEQVCTGYGDDRTCRNKETCWYEEVCGFKSESDHDTESFGLNYLTISNDRDYTLEERRTGRLVLIGIIHVTLAGVAVFSSLVIIASLEELKEIGRKTKEKVMRKKFGAEYDQYLEEKEQNY